jgi:tetratricopeptide (TPR) repeat protein
VLDRALRYRSAACLAFALSVAGSWFCSLANLRASTALAQAAPAKAQSSEYEVAIKLAFEEFEIGNYIEARARFLEAHRLSPNARTLRALGMVEYELQHYVQAVHYLEQALACADRPLTAELRESTAQLLKQTYGYVSIYRISLQPRAASLTVDGTPMASEQLGAVALQAGEHTLEVQAPGHQSVRRTLQVLGGEGESELNIVLLAQHASDAPVRPPDQPTSSRKKWWIWGTVGALVLGGLTAGLVLGLQKRDGDRHVNTGSTGIEIPVPANRVLGARW